MRFAKDSSPDEETRKASQNAAKKMQEAAVDQAMRVDVYEKISRYAELVDRKTLSAEQNRFLDKELRDLRR